MLINGNILRWVAVAILLLTLFYRARRVGGIE